MCEGIDEAYRIEILIWEGAKRVDPLRMRLGFEVEN